MKSCSTEIDAIFSVGKNVLQLENFGVCFFSVEKEGDVVTVDDTTTGDMTSRLEDETAGAETEAEATSPVPDKEEASADKEKSSRPVSAEKEKSSRPATGDKEKSRPTSGEEKQPEEEKPSSPQPQSPSAKTEEKPKSPTQSKPGSAEKARPGSPGKGQFEELVTVKHSPLTFVSIGTASHVTVLRILLEYA